MITEGKWRQLRQWMLALGVNEEQLLEKFITGSGSGGQKINKTASCVQLQHLPTGIIIKCQDDRSRESNRYFARRRLCEKIEEMQRQEKSKRQQAIDKIRRQKKKRSRRAKQKMRDDKHHQSQVKQNRKPPED